MEVRFSWPQISLLLKDGGQHGAAAHPRSLARLGMQTLHAEYLTAGPGGAVAAVGL